MMSVYLSNGTMDGLIHKLCVYCTEVQHYRSEALRHETDVKVQVWNVRTSYALILLCPVTRYTFPQISR